MPLPDLIRKYPFRKTNLTAAEREKEMELRESLLDFLRGLLRTDPTARWTAMQASRHPFITGEPFHGPYEPEPPQVRRWSARLENASWPWH